MTEEENKAMQDAIKDRSNLEEIHSGNETTRK